MLRDGEVKSSEESNLDGQRQSTNGSDVAVFSGSILVTLVSLVLSRTYYLFFYLPEYHGSWLAAMKQIFDFDGWWSYAKSVPGLTFHGIALLSFAVCGVSLWRAWRR